MSQATGRAVRGAALAVGCLLSALAAPAWSAPATSQESTARISYLAGASAYVDAGRLDGLAEGDTVDVLRGGVVIARLRVLVVSSHRASCDTVWTAADVRVGDRVRYLARTPDAPPPDTALVAIDTTAATVVPAPRRAARRVRGRVGLSYQGVEGPGGTLRRPGLDLRLDATDASGHVRADLDFRGRHATQIDAEGSQATDLLTRVYRASLDVHDVRQRRRVVVGRQVASALGPVSLFDGARVELVNRWVDVGAFAGTQPEPVTMQIASDVIEQGVFAGVHGPDLSPRRWSVSVGGVSSIASGSPNRDFLFIAAQGWSASWSANVTQEVDLNRGWKREAGEPALAPTSTFATAHAQLRPGFGVTLGYDDRRNVRLYRDRFTPETQFDDSHRQGVWVGAAVEPGRRMRVAADVRRQDEPGRDDAYTWSATAEAWRFAPLNLGARVRASLYDGAPLETRLIVTSLGCDPFGTAHLELGGGLTRTADSNTATVDVDRWISVALDVSLVGRWYADLSWEANRSDFGSGRQVWLGVSCRL